MASFDPKDPDFAARVRTSFARQTAMATLGIEITGLGAGEIELKMPYAAAYTQQHGFVHAGILTTALDSACGYAAFSLMPADAAVLTVEFKTNLIAPARGDYFLFRARVVKPRPNHHRVRRAGVCRRARSGKTGRDHDRHLDGLVRPRGHRAVSPVGRMG
jgi:uncharacterized protein (TIGR00369 family)